MTWAIKFCMVVFNIVSTLFFSIKRGINSHWLNQVASDNSKVHRSFQDCGSSVQNFLHVICLLHRIWRWLQDFWKIVNPCTYYVIWTYAVGKVLLLLCQIFSHEMYFIYIWCAEIVSDMTLFFHYLPISVPIRVVSMEFRTVSPACASLFIPFWEVQCMKLGKGTLQIFLNHNKIKSFSLLCQLEVWWKRGVMWRWIWWVGSCGMTIILFLVRNSCTDKVEWGEMLQWWGNQSPDFYFWGHFHSKFYSRCCKA